MKTAMRALAVMFAVAGPAAAQALLGIGSAGGAGIGPAAGYVIVNELAVRADRGFDPARHAPQFGNLTAVYESTWTGRVDLPQAGTCIGQCAATHLFFRDLTLGQASPAHAALAAFSEGAEGRDLGDWLRRNDNHVVSFGRMIANLQVRLGNHGDRGDRLKAIAHATGDEMVNAATQLVGKRGTVLLEMVLHGTGSRFTPGKHAILGYRVADALVQAGGAPPERAVAIRVWDSNDPAGDGHAVLVFPDGRVTYTAGLLARYKSMALPAGRDARQAIQAGQDLTVWMAPVDRMAELARIATTGTCYLDVSTRIARMFPAE